MVDERAQALPPLRTPSVAVLVAVLVTAGAPAAPAVDGTGWVEPAPYGLELRMSDADIDTLYTRDPFSDERLDGVVADRESGRLYTDAGRPSSFPVRRSTRSPTA